MSLQARYADLVAFVESRDRQLTLPMGEDCGRESGQFAPGNNCAAGGGSSGRVSRPRPNPVTGGPRANTSNGFPSAWNREQSISHTGSLPGLQNISKISVDNPKRVTSLAKQSGFKSVASLVRFGAADSKKSEVDISESAERVRRSGPTDGSPARVSTERTLTIESKTPVYSGDRKIGHVEIDVAIRKYDDEPPIALYGLFSVDRSVQYEIGREKSDSESGESPIERQLSATIIDKMLSSLEEAEKAGASKAKTFAAGSDYDTTYKGYRLWGRFGFDATLSENNRDKALSANETEQILSPEIAKKVADTGVMTLQDLISTKAGERWWARNGSGLYLTLDFSSKDSAGYQRYKRMLERSKKAKERGQRSYEDFCEFALSTHRDLAEWRGFSQDSLETRYASLVAFAQSRNCGTGEGGFQKGNTCASGKIADAAAGAAAGAIKGAVLAAGATGPFPPYIAKGAAVGAAVGAVKGLYDNSMQPTRVMQKIGEIGTSEKQVADLVQRLGGSPQSMAKVKDGKLTLRVRDSKGEKIFDVEMGKSKYTITPSRKSGTLTGSEIAQVKKIADENSPKEVSVVVKSKSPSYVAKLVRKGFQVTANAAGTLIATVVLPTSASVAVAMAEGAVDSIKKKM